jgi:hypothetical protein
MRRRFAAALIGGILLAGGTLGCRTARTSFQMDSDSQTPQLGLQLTPSKDPHASSGQADSTRAIKGHLVEIDRQDEEPPRASRPSWWNRWSKPKRIPLPVTDTTGEQEAPGRIAGDDQAAEF